MECNINSPKHSQKIEADAKPCNTETRGTIRKKKGHIGHHIKQVRKQYHQKYTHTLQNRNSRKKCNSNYFWNRNWHHSFISFITPNNKLQIHKWSRNTILITVDPMISGINEKTLSKKYHVKVRPFPGALADDMHHHLRLYYKNTLMQLF